MLALRCLWAAALVAALAGPAQGAESAARKATQAVPLTAKERLSGKAADAQRVNDCKVPKEDRGASTRPDDCDHVKRSTKGAGQ